MKIKPPKIDSRGARDLLKLLNERVPFYTPEWAGTEEDDPGNALLRIFPYLADEVTKRLNQVPRQKFAAFLDMLGIQRLPAQPARVPLTFTLSGGTEKEILIPRRTRAAAAKTGEHEELPFEIEKNLLAVPSLLKQVISVDPAEDAVYLPPPGFLEPDEKEKSQTAVIYTIVSSPSKGGKNFQLDHVTELEEGDFLLIGTGKTLEYVIVAAVNGAVVTVTDRLLNSFPAGTGVQKLDAFDLFQGKNMQEHSIYLGHKDLFNIKSKAAFSLHVTHREGTAEGVTPLDFIVEYWGKREGDDLKEEEKVEEWRAFSLTDGTAGFSNGGIIDLVKPEEGEITEKKIFEQDSRWIRCRLTESLGVNESRKLPMLDNIVFTVKSSGKDLQPDQAFNGETPLDPAQPFYPFGNEPRMFNTFALAGKEIFSKKNAEVTLDVEIGTLGPPSAITLRAFYYEGVRHFVAVFAIGTYGQLIGVGIGSSEGHTWEDFGCPPNTRLAPGSTPYVVIKEESKTIEQGEVEIVLERRVEKASVFARAENGHLIEFYFETEKGESKMEWIDHGTPGEGINVRFDPAAISIYKGSTEPKIYRPAVFVAGSDGSLYEFYHDSDSNEDIWIDRGKPSGISIDSSPYIGGYTKNVFVKGKDGNLYEFGRDYWGNGRWFNYGPPAVGVKVDSRPFAVSYREHGGEYAGIVFLKGSDGNLWRCETYSEFGCNWNDWGRPSDSVSIDSAPHGYIVNPSESPGEEYIYVRGSDGHTWSCKYSISAGHDRYWTDEKRPGYSKPVFSPFVLPTFNEINNIEKLVVFSASNRNSIIGTEDLTDETVNPWHECTETGEAVLNPSLSWEYWNNKGWVALKGVTDGTANLLESGKITFKLPEDIGETEVAGQKNYWIRARIVGGDYGKETYSLTKTTQSPRVKSTLSEKATSTQVAQQIDQQLISTKSTIKPPVVNSISISYELTAKTFPQQCLTYNNLAYIDHTEAAKLDDKFFSPFLQPEEENKTLYLGFEKFFKGGPVKIFFDAKELPYTENKKPKFQWNYSKKKEWGEMSVLDNTEALIMTEILEFIGNEDFSADSRFGHYLYWLKATLVEGEYDESQSPLLYGIYPNTAWALQAETAKDEILGSGTGEAEQTVSFRKFPVREGEEIRVRETLTEEEKTNLTRLFGTNTVYEEKDDQGDVTETWVLWTEVSYFYDSGPEDRHYTLDRATGEICFGDGKRGMVPPAGENNIKAFTYQAVSGGIEGNVKAGEIKNLKSAAAGVDKVFNPIAADGGADTASLDDMLEIGPAAVSHRNRAVTVEDFQWLAKNASRKVAKVRCFPNTNNKKQKEAGWVTVIIIPRSTGDKPVPSLELRRKVQKYLQSHCANTLNSDTCTHIFVDGPFKDNELLYREVNVSMDVYVHGLDVASVVEREIKKTLKTFFHPLTGGPESSGWDFGRSVSASDIYALLEKIEGVDHVENLTFIDGGEPVRGDILKIEEDFLAADGTHAVKLYVKKGGQSYGIENTSTG